MKGIFTFITLLFAVSFASAQNNAAISACNDPSGGIQIVYDYSLNCTAAPGSFVGLDTIGFHSGGTTDPADGWNSGGATMEWDATGAVNGMNDGNDVFTVYIADVDAYYAGSTGIARINFVFNQGPANGDAPWDSEGKDDDGAGGCQDFNVIIDDITDACAKTASIRNQVIDLGFNVAPNPFNEQATITFANTRNESFNVSIMDLSGRVVRNYGAVNGTSLTVEKGELAAGMYLATFVNEEGKRAATRLMVN